MKKELTSRETVFITSLMLLGRLSAASESAAGRDIWLVFLLVPLLSVPVIRVFYEISTPRGDLKARIAAPFGSVLVYPVLVLLCLEAISISALGINLFSTYLSATPMEHNCALRAVILMSAVYFVTLSVPLSSFGRTVSVLFPITVLIIVVSFVASFGKIDIKALTPVFERGISPAAKGVASALTLQIAPLFYMPYVSSEEKSAKPFYAGLFISCGLLLLSHTRNVLILGFPAVTKYRFPNYIAMTQISLGDFFQGMEILMTCIFVICQPIRSAVCLRFANDALSSVFPKTRKIWKFALPFLCGAIVLSGYNRTNITNEMTELICGIPLFAVAAAAFVLLEVKRLKRRRGTV